MNHMNNNTEIKITVIGGGSKGWALTLMKDLALARDLSGEVCLYDIHEQAAQSNQKLGEQIFSHNIAYTWLNTTAQTTISSRFSVSVATTVKEALSDADFVIVSIEPGSIEHRHTDLVIPAKYGILQTVGDTIGPGGIFRALRAIPIFRDYAKHIKEYCPHAWVINYTNPMTWCTQAMVKEFPEINILGCCHEVFGTQKFIAQQVAEWFQTEVPHHKEIHLNITGVNHFTFATKATWQGHNLYPFLLQLAKNPTTWQDKTEIAQQRIAEENWFESDHHIALDFLRNFGALGAAGDRHLAEFVPWYLKDTTELHRYGVIHTPYEWRVATDHEKKSKIYSKEDLVPEPSDEEGVAIIRALLGLAPLYTNVNIPNTGQVNWLQRGHVVETNAYIDRGSITPTMAQAPPLAVQSMVRGVAQEQEQLLESAWSMDKDGIFQAFLLDPLVQLPVRQARALFEDMWEEQYG